MFRRLHKELNVCAKSPMVKSIECPNIQRWNCTLRCGYKFSIDVTNQSYPFHVPRLENVPEHVICGFANGWTPATTMLGIITTVYHETGSYDRTRKRIIMGLLRTIPMMMLWRKRATEAVFHPSRIDFAKELKELGL